MSDALAAPNIITPHALPMFRDGDGLRPGSKRKREKERMDPKKSKRPELPVTGPGRGGRVGASATQHVVQNLVRDTTRDEDVRASFLFVPSNFSLSRTRLHCMHLVISAGVAAARGKVWTCGGVYKFSLSKFQLSRRLPALVPLPCASLMTVYIVVPVLEADVRDLFFFFCSLGKPCSSTQNWQSRIHNGREVRTHFFV